jgi:SnoaL-like domain
MTESLLLGISETVIGFYRALDLRQDPAEEFFAHDGVWMRLGQALQGREAIRSALESRDASRISCHLVSNLRARAVANGKAESDYFVTVYEGINDAPMRLVSILNAHDELALLEGHWKISHKHSRRHLPFTP